MNDNPFLDLSESNIANVRAMNAAAIARAMDYGAAHNRIEELRRAIDRGKFDEASELYAMAVDAMPAAEYSGFDISKLCHELRECKRALHVRRKTNSPRWQIRYILTRRTDEKT